MIVKQSTVNGIHLRTEDGREFHLTTIPVPVLPFDRYDVEQQVQVMLDDFAQGEFFPMVHVYSLKPLRYTLQTFHERPAERWWAHS